MNAAFMRELASQINGRTLSQELEPTLERLPVELQRMVEGIQKASRDFPLSLEPAAVFTPLLTTTVDIIK